MATNGMRIPLTAVAVAMELVLARGAHEVPHNRYGRGRRIRPWRPQGAARICFLFNIRKPDEQLRYSWIACQLEVGTLLGCRHN